MNAEQMRLLLIALASCLSASIISTGVLWLVVWGSTRLSERRAEVMQRAERRGR